MIWALCLLACLLAGGAAYEQLGGAVDRRRYPPLGRLVRTGGTRLHVLESGQAGPPLVVLEAGLAGSLMGWALVQTAASDFAHIVSYDRAGLGWSELAKVPRTVDQMTGELHGLLQELRLQPPYVLVGHSFGGLLVRAFAYRYPAEVSGLVLVDPVSLEAWSLRTDADQRRLERGVALSRRGARLARFGVVRAALSLASAGARWLPNLISKTAAAQGRGLIERMLGEIRLLPSEHTPRIRAHWSSPKCFRAMGDYLEALPVCARTVCDWQLPPEIAITVLSASDATAAETAERDRWVAHSVRGEHIRIPDCGHWIQIRRADAVVEAIRELVGEVRRR